MSVFLLQYSKVNFNFTSPALPTKYCQHILIKRITQVPVALLANKTCKFLTKEN